MQASLSSPTKRSRDYKPEENPKAVKQSKALSNEELLAGMAEILKEATAKLHKKIPSVSKHVRPNFKVKLHCFGEKVPFTFKISKKGELTLLQTPKFLSSPFFNLNKPCQNAVLGALSSVAECFSQQCVRATSIVECLTQFLERRPLKIIDLKAAISKLEEKIAREEEGDYKEGLKQKQKLIRADLESLKVLKLSRLPANLPSPEPDSVLSYDSDEGVLIRKRDGFFPDNFIEKSESGDLKFASHTIRPKEVFSSIAFRSRNTAMKELHPAVPSRTLPPEERAWPSYSYEEDLLYHSYFDSKRLASISLFDKLKWFQTYFEPEKQKTLDQESLSKIFTLASEITTAELGTLIESEKLQGLPNLLTTPLALHERVIIKRTNGSFCVGEVHAMYNDTVEVYVGDGIKRVKKNKLDAIAFRSNLQIPFLKLNSSQTYYDQWL